MVRIKYYKVSSIFICFLLFTGCNRPHESSIFRYNQLGYLPLEPKSVIVISNTNLDPDEFRIIKEDQTDISTEFVIKSHKENNRFLYKVHFDSLNQIGNYYFVVKNDTSGPIKIGYDIYADGPDVLLKYMRQQRCGYNPFLADSCHIYDGYTVYNASEEFINVVGGWHDATDYLQYLPTSANATLQMFFSVMDYPTVVNDKVLANGLPGQNGQNDMLDEALWGLDWILSMNPSVGVYYNQIADDRDHAGFRLPNKDSVDYGWGPGKGRPVYRITGEPQGLFSNKNRTKGVASSAGKFSSVFAIASLSEIDSSKKQYYIEKAIQAYNYGIIQPGETQTAPGKAPYFYEEDNWKDDMALASALLFQATGDQDYLNSSLKWIREESIVPWMGSDTARHYQWYPFINISHFILHRNVQDQKIKSELAEYYKNGLESIRGNINNPYGIGVPFIWCSNNYVAAALTQCLLYREMTGSKEFLGMEIDLRNWLFGMNPWGTSMIVGYPEYGDYPEDPHSSLSFKYGHLTVGGLIDGPLKPSIFNNLKGLSLFESDEYSDFQTSWAVYHDDAGDYSTNEPTMDGTAMLFYYISWLAEKKYH